MAIVGVDVRPGTADGAASGEVPAGIVGVAVRPLDPNLDVRGSVCEIHRDSWGLAPRPVQWDFIVTRANVLRGVHVHRLRYDYMVVTKGRGTFGFADLRPNSPSFRRSMTVEASGERPCVVIVPPGVAHGIYAHDDMIYLYGLTAYWAGTDEIGCRFDDPAMNIPWPVKDPVLLARDAELPDFEALLRRFLEAGGVAPGL
jgi:dTDP-4-dehydrorhamnose 3,5-epimerase